MPKPRYVLGTERRTGFFTWCCAFLCAFIFTIVIVIGIVVFVGYLAIRPKVPLLYVHAARLDRFDYNQAGVLAVRLTIIMRAENHNMKAHVSFYDTKLILAYQGLSIAQLVADPFEVRKNMSTELNYVVESSPIPLDPQKQYFTEQSLAKTKTMPFFLKGSSRTRWRVGPLGSVKFWLHINCHLQLPIDYTPVYPRFDVPVSYIFEFLPFFVSVSSPYPFPYPSQCYIGYNCICYLTYPFGSLALAILQFCHAKN